MQGANSTGVANPKITVDGDLEISGDEATALEQSDLVVGGNSRFTSPALKLKDASLTATANSTIRFDSAMVRARALLLQLLLLLLR